MSDKILESLDGAVEILLKTAGLGPKVEGENETLATLAEQVKAFEAVVDWAKARPSLAPKTVVETQFDKLRRDFNGEKVERRGRRPKAEKIEPESELDAGVQEPIQLFDA
ncbi:MAG: hypothetical protein KGL39_05330 [Patescibacteria group bacterium]|nr:hypothetical protein [Patescibacteria group bacterium]